MQYDAKSPKAYFDMLPEDWRKPLLLEVRAMIRTHAPELEENICYKMLCYGTGDTVGFGLNAQKHYVSLYVGDIDRIPDSAKDLEGFHRGKGCIRLRKTARLSDSGLEAFIRKAVDLWRREGNLDC